jgi:hypothetical protein
MDITDNAYRCPYPQRAAHDSHINVLARKIETVATMQNEVVVECV